MAFSFYNIGGAYNTVALNKTAINAPRSTVFISNASGTLDLGGVALVYTIVTPTVGGTLEILGSVQEAFARLMSVGGTLVISGTASPAWAFRQLPSGNLLISGAADVEFIDIVQIMHNDRTVMVTEYPNTMIYVDFYEDAFAVVQPQDTCVDVPADNTFY